MQSMDADLQAAFQAQFNQERQNRDVYHDLEHGFLLLGLEGFATWAHEQAQEERHHAKRIGYYLAEKRNIRPEIQPTPAQSFAFDAPLLAFEHAAELEAMNTGLISDLYDKAELANDSGACLFLHWFIREQENSEADFNQWILNLRLIVNEGAGLLAMDKKFAKEYGE